MSSALWLWLRGRTRPVLALNLLSSLDSRITFTRASAGWRFGSDGLWGQVGNDVPRFDYDPATPAGTVDLFSASSVTAGVTTSGQGISGLSTTADLTSGRRYLVTYTVTVCVGQLSAAIPSQGVNGTAQTVNWTGTFAETLVSNATGAFLIGLAARGSGVTSVTGSVTVQELSYTPKGLLIESAATNLLLSNRDFRSNANGNPIVAWTNTDVTPTRNQVGIDGAANSACLITEGVAGTALTTQAATVTAGSTITYSEVFKRGDTNWIRLIIGGPGLSNGAEAFFNLATGAKGVVNARGTGTNNASTIINEGGGFYRLTITSTPDGSYTSGNVAFASATGDNNAVRVPNATYIVDAAQLEVGSFATSIIVTGAATVTRAADSAVMTGANFSSWFNATQGTFVVDAFSFGYGSGGASCPVMASDGTGANIIGVGQVTGGAMRSLDISNASVTQALFSTGGYTLPTSIKASGAYANNDCAGSVFGTTVQTDVTAAIPTVNQLHIGSSISAGAQTLNGHIRSIKYYNTRLPNATIQALASA